MGVPSHVKRDFEDFWNSALRSFFVLYLVALRILFGIAETCLGVFSFLYTGIKRVLKKQNRCKKSLVILGGGYAGTNAASSLEEYFNVTLIDNKPYFEFTPSKLRLLQHPEHYKQVQKPHDEYLLSTNIVQDHVVKVSGTKVSCKHCEIDYDYLIVCTGARYSENLFSTPLGKSVDTIKASVVSARAQDIEKYSSAVESSHSILVIGGGAVGVELAAELVERWKDKTITIVNSQQNLLAKSPARAIDYAEQYFKRNCVTVLVNERVISAQGKQFKTTSGKVIEADLAFLCTGNIPNTDFLKDTELEQHVNAFGYIQVNEYLQIPEHGNVFAAGDVTDIPEEEEKLCQTAGAEIALVISNIWNMENGKPLQKFRARKFPMLVSLGRYDCVFMYRGWTLCGLFPAMMKEFVEW
eukprot:CAMPEP_0168560460 /NCGR_PEP_ID=MMETSP0413-20121227/11073_1 /TAXON_ID=136452 /ORGANISM="Filamoeba nolandi, Strain NC-AS-23-1" /LENGTH=410 /DNA_ID=CAMNT_0008591765 /DNA_START=79 /DNA_END=1308 /DNA_ORIENTATION=-